MGREGETKEGNVEDKHEDGNNGKHADGKKQDKDRKNAKSSSPAAPGALSSPGAPTPTFRTSTLTDMYYSLHRDIIALRQAEHRRRQ